MAAGAVISLACCLLSAVFVAADNFTIEWGVLKCKDLPVNFNLSRLPSGDDLANLEANYDATEADADAHCHNSLFANTTYLASNRSETALETADFLKAGWQQTKGRLRQIFCPLRDTSCEWGYLGKLGQYFESLDNFLNKFFDELIPALYEATEKLAQGQVPEQFKDVCTPVNVSVLGCELKRIGKILGEACGKRHVTTLSDCGGDSWPIGYVRQLRQGCWWPAISGPYHNFTQIRTVARFLASRLPYLANAYLPVVGPKLINETADAYGEVGWPTAENDAKYEKFAAKIEENFKRDYEGFPPGSEVRRYIVFYPCDENSFAMLRRAYSENTFVRVHRPDVNVIVRRYEGPLCPRKEQEWMSKCSDIISLAYRSNGKTATERLQGVDKLMQEWSFGERSCFRAIIAIECAKVFVWYELGYQYFPAWHGDGNLAVVSLRSDGAYRSAPVCADIIFVGWDPPTFTL